MDYGLFLFEKKNVCLPTQIVKTCKQLSFFSILTLPIRWSEQSNNVQFIFTDLLHITHIYHLHQLGDKTLDDNHLHGGPHDTAQ